MATHVEIGINRTGIGTAPELAAQMLRGAEEFPPTAGDGRELASARARFAREAEPLGHLPPPETLKGMAKTAMQAVKGGSPTLLLDKLGERLAFERSGVRLYEGLLTKFDAVGPFAGGPSREELVEILAEELAHFRMLEECIEDMGADPTVITPSADLHATLTRGALDVVADPRTDVAQGLEAALVLELADNDCWSALVELSSQGAGKLSKRFNDALADEERHLQMVRAWLAQAQGRASETSA